MFRDSFALECQYPRTVYFLTKSVFWMIYSVLFHQNHIFILVLHFQFSHAGSKAELLSADLNENRPSSLYYDNPPRPGAVLGLLLHNDDVIRVHLTLHLSHHNTGGQNPETEPSHQRTFLHVITFNTWQERHSTV